MASAAEQKHWQKNLRLTGLLIVVWLAINFGVIWFAPDLNRFTMIGPLGFYMAAQGAPICYLLIIGWYARRMRQLDAAARAADDD